MLSPFSALAYTQEAVEVDKQAAARKELEDLLQKSKKFKGSDATKQPLYIFISKGNGDFENEPGWLRKKLSGDSCRLNARLNEYERRIVGLLAVSLPNSGVQMLCHSWAVTAKTVREAHSDFIKK